MELFAGVGGFRLGLERSSEEWTTIWANQYEPSRKSQWAFECYVENFCENDNIEEIYKKNKNKEDTNPWNSINFEKINDEAINKFSNMDIAKVDTEVIPNHTLLTGGFPCQDYSVATTKAQGIKGKKGVLWWQIERIVRDKMPNFILLENVNRLIKSHGGRDFGLILASLNNLGYTVEWRVVNAADYGLRQRRRRVFIFASREDNFYSQNILRERTHNVLTKSGFFLPTFPVVEESEDPLKSTTIGSNLVEVTNKFKFNFENAGFMKNGEIYTRNVDAKKSKKKMVIKDILETQVAEKYFLDEKNIADWEYLKGSKAIERTSKNGHKYIYREGSMTFPDPVNKPARTILTSESSKNRSSHVIKDPETGRLRKITPNECDQLNHFPKGWTATKTMSHSFRYFAMGNALVVELIKKMGKRLNGIIEKENMQNGN